MDDASLVRELSERIVTYLLADPRDLPVRRDATPEEVDAALRPVGLAMASGAPPVPPDALLAAVDAVVRHSVHTRHPRFFNQNFAGADVVAVLGDALGAALNTTNATFEAAPVFTLMEEAVLRRLAAIAGFSETTLAPGLFCPGGSTAALYALQLARHRYDPDIARRGSREDFAIFVSDQGHYAAEKSAALLGLGTEAVIKVATDDLGALRPESLRDALSATERSPLAVIATAGTTVTAAFDPLEPIAEICAARDLWLHVDGCYGGSALFSPRERHRLAGVERAHSFAWNLHKMMGMTQQCSVLLLRDPDQLGPCFSARANYLFQPDKPYAELDTGDRTFQCARRNDVLKLWLTWKARGDAGFAARVERAVDLAAHARDHIARHDAFAPVVAGDFTNVCFIWVPPPLRPFDGSEAARARIHDVTAQLKGALQRSGVAMLSHMPVAGLNAFRLLVMNPDVTEADIETTLGTIDGLGRDLVAGG